MKYINKIIFVFISFLLIFLFLPNLSLAESNFNTSFDVTYKVNDSGLTHVTFKGSLINKTDGYYASSYSIKVGFPDVENISASDGEGNINTSISKSANQTEITLPFNQKVIGKD